MNIIEAFEKIRGIPYRIPLRIGEEDNCCTGKIKRFKSFLDKHGYESRYRVCEFRWSDLALPEKVASIEHEDNSTHAFLEIKIDNHWVRVDPTWDKAVKSILPVNEWNGKNNTEIAVKPRNIYDVEKSAKIMNEESSEDIKKDLRMNGTFYKAFNEWLEENRK